MKPVFIKFGLLVAFIFVNVAAVNASQTFAENAQYKRVAPESIDDSSKKGKIEIIEFFLYSCEHCYKLDPKLKAWVEENKDKVTFKRVPAIISASWVTLAKAYYIAEKLNVLDKIHDQLFKAIHVDKKVYLNEYKLAEFFEEQGVSGDQFLHEFNATDIVKKVSDARVLSVNYGFRGVPAVVINEEFKTAPFYNKTQEEMLDVIGFLVDKINTRRGNLPPLLLRKQ